MPRVPNPSWGVMAGGSLWRMSRGTVVGCAVDIGRREIRFSDDGEWGANTLAFKDFEFSGGLMPAVTFCGLCSQRIKLNFGKFKFAHKFPRTHGEDSEYHAVDEWIRAYKPNPDDEELTIPIQRPFWR